MTPRLRATSAALAAAALLVVSACAGSSAGGDPQLPGDSTTSTTTPSTTVTSSTTSTTTSTTTSSTTTTTTTAAPTTTTTPVTDEAEGSGCTPGPGDLPDGEWFGYVLTTAGDELDFDLACWFTGDAAARAAAEDGEESPPPNDYYIRNINELVRTVPVAADAGVTWFPDFGDPTSEETATYADWIDLIEDRDFMPGVWLEVEDGEVVAIQEQWVP